MRLLLILLAACLSAAPFESCDYRDDVAAAAAWRPIEGSPQARSLTEAGRSALRLDCPFATFKGSRVYWDHPLAVDLTRAEGLRFDIRCRDLGPISAFHLYLETKSGWYNASFIPQRPGQWQTIELRKADFHIEGKPTGWSELRTLRLAAYRAGESDTSFEVRDIRPLGVLGEDTHILLINASEAGERFDTVTSRFLSAQGIRHAQATEAEITPDLLARAGLVILPNNGKLPPTTVDTLVAYLENGGRLLAFYSLPAKLQAAAGFAPGKHLKPAEKGVFAAIRPVGPDLIGAPSNTQQSSWNIISSQPVAGRSHAVAEWLNAAGQPSGYPAVLASSNAVLMTHVLLDEDRAHKSQLLLAMVGHLLPSIWHETIAARLSRLDTMGQHADFAAACAYVRSRAPADSEAIRRLDDAIRLHTASRAQEKAQAYTDALKSADEAYARFEEAYCLAHPAKPGEFRAVWCHNAYGVKGRTWDDAIANLKANGFTAIMPNMLWGGVAFYPSEVLPVAAGVADKGDQIAECLAACRKYGLQIHVWKVDWNLGHEVPAAFVARLRAEHRLQQSDTGEEEPWLCPSHPLNGQLEHDALVEVARKYPVDGIHFDYIRYPDGHHCFCPGCRTRFETSLGSTLAQWPADVRPKGVHHEEWIKFCQENINQVVRTTSEDVRKVRPGIKVSAAVFRQWDQDSRVVMQDWKLWCARGWLDFVCPMDYTESETGYAGWLRLQKTWAGPAGLVPGIGISSSHSSLSPDATIRQIELTRAHGTGGFILFNYGEREAREMIPLLGLGPTKSTTK